jgi:hypothetical protein
MQQLHWTEERRFLRSSGSVISTRSVPMCYKQGQLAQLVYQLVDLVAVLDE